MDYWSIGVCNHRSLCLRCSLRFRVLYRDHSCPLCKTDLPVTVALPPLDPRNFADVQLPSSPLDPEPQQAVIKIPPRMTTQMLDQLKHGLPNPSPSSPAAPAAEEISLPRLEKAGAIYLLDLPAVEICNALLHRVACRVCNAEFASLPELKRHLGGAHGQTFCEVCLRGRKLFLPEQKVYACGKGLKLHMKSGDKGDPEAPRGHTPCLFCSKHFFGTDEHYEHMNEVHEECQMCRMHGKLYQFFADYASLEAHFEHEHHLCKDQRCLATRYVVFATEFELKAHDIAFHLENRKLSKREERAARSLQLAITYSSTSGNTNAPSNSSSSSSSSATRNDEAMARELSRVEAEQREHLRMLALAEQEKERRLRNDSVVASMIQLIGDDGYNRFKGFSKLFLQNSLSASDFYLKFQQTFGEAKADELFEGVVDLLPPQFASRAAALRAARARAIERKSQFPSLSVHHEAQPRLSSSNLSYLTTARMGSAPAKKAAGAPRASSSSSSHAPFKTALTRNLATPSSSSSSSSSAASLPGPASSSLSSKGQQQQRAQPNARGGAKAKPATAPAFPALSGTHVPASKAPTWGPKPAPKKKQSANQSQAGKSFTVIEPPAQRTPKPSIITPPPGVNFHEIFTTPVPPSILAGPTPTPIQSTKKKNRRQGQETLLSWG